MKKLNDICDLIIKATIISVVFLSLIVTGCLFFFYLFDKFEK